MPLFTYKAIDAEGSITKGEIDAVDAGVLSGQLRQKGLAVISCRKHGGFRLPDISSLIAGLGRVSRKELIEFSNNMGVMIRAGLPLINSLEDLRSDTKNIYFRKLLKDIIRRVNVGSSLHDALSSKRKTFPPLYTSIVQIAENTGRLETAFFDLARHYQRIQDTKSSIIRAIIYPSFVFIVLFAALYVFLFLVFPVIMTMIEDFQIELPRITEVVKTVLNVLSDHYRIIPFLFIWLVIMLIMLRKIEKTRYFMDWCQLKLPIIRSFFIKLHMSFFSQYMSSLQNAGIDILSSLKLTTDLINNLVLKRILTRCRTAVKEGRLLSDTLRDVSFVPSMIIRMIAVGESSGNLNEQMEYVAKQYNKELERQIEIALALFEPILIILIAALVLTLVMAVFMPIYKIVSTISIGAGAGW